MQYYNVHCHVFTMQNAPERFLHLYLPDFLASAIDKMTNTQAGAKALAEFLSQLPSVGAKRYASFLSIGKSAGQADVFTQLMKQYDDPDIKFTALTMFMEECGAGNSSSGFDGQLDELLPVKQQYPDRLLIFLGVDPRWDTKGKSLKATVQSYFDTKIKVNANRSVYPFVGLKLYPSTGFYAFDERLKETFEWAADNGVPILSHCNYLGGIYNNNKAFLQANLNPLDPYTGQAYNVPTYQNESKFWKKITGTNEARNNKITCSYFLEPESYRTMLSYFKNEYGKELKLSLAHYGGDQQIQAAYNAQAGNQQYGVNPLNWYRQIQNLMTEYSNLYTDFAYAIYNSRIHPNIITDVQKQPFGDRILFGTDFFMTEQEMPEKNDYTTFRANAMKALYRDGTVWDQTASKGIERFLYSPYYPGYVI